MQKVSILTSKIRLLSHSNTVLEPICYRPDDDFASVGNSQYFGGSGVASEYPDNIYPEKNLIILATVIVYSSVSNLRRANGVGVEKLRFRLISINRHLHVNADT